MITAFYARVSGDRQKEEKTISSQLQELRDFAAQENLQIDEKYIYLDEAESGYYLDRPGLDALRDAARDGLIDMILVHDPDRFSRKYAYQVLLLEEFKRWNVDVRFLKHPQADSPEKQLLIQIQGVIAEYERARIMERTRRGRLYWIRQGRPLSARVPYGYRHILKGKNNPPSIEVDEENVEVVRKIFELYAHEGLSASAIAVYLKNANVPSAKDRLPHWDSSSIRFILMNEAYTGTWYLNQYKREPRPGQMRPRTVKRPREEWVPVPVPPLLSTELFTKAQEIRESGVHQGIRPLRYPETHLLRRLVVCGHCNKKMSPHYTPKNGYRYYWCRTIDSVRMKGNKERCPNPTISTPELDKLAWSDVVSLLTDPELILSAWKEQNQIGHKESLAEDEKRTIRKQIADGKEQRKRLLDAYEAGVIELHEFVSRRNSCDKKIERAKMKLNDLYVVNGEEMSGGNLKNNIEEACKSLSNGLESMDMERKMKLCRDLIEKVVVKKHDVKIHYKFPVSSNFNNKRECHAFLTLQSETPVVRDISFKISAVKE
jgi:site-specific DNA recombinase